MSMRVVSLLALLAISANALSADEKMWKERPVQKVVGMLEEMKAELEKEAEADEETSDKMTCYCDSNTKEKKKSVAAAEARITELTSLIEENTAKSATLSTEISTLEGEVADNTAALGKANEIRTKENGEFAEDKANMAEGITGLTGAVNSLSKQHGGALTQESFMALKGKLERIGVKLEKVIPQQKRFLSFLQRQAPTNSGSYAPQSGAIFGVLKQMKEGFETNLADAEKEETSAASTFADLKASKTAEVNSASTSIQSKTAEKADADETAATSKNDLAETQASLAADNDFLANLKVECDNFAAEYSERTTTRTQEVAAVGEVIGMLTGDDAHDLFSRTYNFVQKKSTVSRAEKVANMLSASGKKLNRPSLVALAVSMKQTAGLSGMANVKDKVQKMIDDLMAEAKEDENVYTKCTKELKENADSTEAGNEAKAELQANIDDLTNTVANLKDAIATLNQEIVEGRVSMKRASEDREAENKEFQATVADQRATQAILTKALGRLKEFYEAKSLLQIHAKAPYKKNAASGGVMMMIEGVIKDAANLEKESLKAEQDAQTGYETMITDSNNSIAAKQADIASKTELKGGKEGDLVSAEGDMKSTDADLQALAGVNTALHADCDFVVNNMDIRGEARGNEIESLKNALAMLSGADFR